MHKVYDTGLWKRQNFGCGPLQLHSDNLKKHEYLKGLIFIKERIRDLDFEPVSSIEQELHKIKIPNYVGLHGQKVQKSPIFHGQTWSFGLKKQITDCKKYEIKLKNKFSSIWLFQSCCN